MRKLIVILSFIFMGLTIVGLFFSSMLDKFFGHDIAMENGYLSIPMILLWSLMGISGAVGVWLWRKRMSISSILLHFSFLGILVGAAVTHFKGLEGSVVLYIGEKIGSFRVNDESVNFPFTITLLDMNSVYYPGTLSPADYRSRLYVESGGEGGEYESSMKRIVEVDGYRFFQSAVGDGYVRYRVNHDGAGRIISYIGYLMMALSMVGFFFSRRTGFRIILRRVGMVSLLLISSLDCLAAPASTSKYNDIKIDKPKVLQRPLAKNFGKLTVYWNGRLCPVQTMARDFCYKLYGGRSYKGYSAEQVLTGWLFYYDSWMADSRSKELLSDAGKASLISGVSSGAYFRIYPVVSGDGPVGKESRSVTFNSWIDRLPDDIDPEKERFVRGSMEFVAREIGRGKFNSANQALDRIGEWQRREAGDTYPKEYILNAERIYNSLPPIIWPGVIFISVGILLYIKDVRIGRKSDSGGKHSEWKKDWRPELWTGIIGIGYLTFILALRWIITGHIPLTDGYETMLFMAWGSILLATVIGRRIPILFPVGVIMSGLSQVVAWMSEKNPSLSLLTPVLDSPFLSIHVALVMTAYTLFMMMAVNSAGSFFSRLKRSKEKIADISTLLLYPALFCLGAGIFIGAVWADHSWGRYWGWDQKETWALITFLVYSLPLHSRATGLLRSGNSRNIYYAAAFAVVVFTYFGVNYLMPGLHSYSAG